MNFLAHIYLSGNNDDLCIGNFMADSIKGKDYNLYSGNLKKGILLHRKIDSFTDTHPLVQKSSHRLFSKYRHYNSVIVDVFYDHFLAKNWNEYHPTDLKTYVDQFYKLLEENIHRTPGNIQYMFPYMKSQNWLYNYRKIDGIRQILTQMENRIRGNFNIQHSVSELIGHYEDFEKEFRLFFSDIQLYVEKQLKELDVR